MELYTIEQVAQILRVNPRTVRRYIEKGQLRGERIGGGWRISEEAVKEMFVAPELKEGIADRLQKQSEDMLEQYMRGTHRLQQGGESMVLTVYLFDPSREPWVIEKSAEWMTLFKRFEAFDFTMTASEQGLYRLTLVSPPAVAQTLLGELEHLRGLAFS